MNGRWQPIVELGKLFCKFMTRAFMAVLLVRGHLHMLMGRCHQQQEKPPVLQDPPHFNFLAHMGHSLIPGVQMAAGLAARRAGGITLCLRSWLAEVPSGKEIMGTFWAMLQPVTWVHLEQRLVLPPLGTAALGARAAFTQASRTVQDHIPSWRRSGRSSFDIIFACPQSIPSLYNLYA